MTDGEEKTIQCDIAGFYPEKLAVTWQIQNGSGMVHAGGTHLTRVCTEMAVANPDGTYSIRSGITVHSSAVRGGEIQIICQIEHQTFRGPFKRAVTLTVQGEIMRFSLCDSYISAPYKLDVYAQWPLCELQQRGP